ncbi:hypothetical protein [Paraburkholderia sp. J12]|uniref:hypothetical protein n=1 Tax=Paraburkholderia sp. J12 TaxID=2805432 RepID=UPI002ABDAB79|nr:hypothetical protein [Paraburkholderia sp. J12]
MANALIASARRGTGIARLRVSNCCRARRRRDEFHDDTGRERDEKLPFRAGGHLGALMRPAIRMQPIEKRAPLAGSRNPQDPVIDARRGESRRNTKQISDRRIVRFRRQFDNWRSI